MLFPMTFSDLGLVFQADLCNITLVLYVGRSIDRHRELLQEWILPLNGQGYRSGY